MARVQISKVGELIPEDVRKILVGAAIAGLGAVLTYLLEQIPSVDLGQWTPLVVAVLSVLVNAVRKFATETRY